MAKGGVLPQRRREQQAFLVPILGDVGDARLAALTDRIVGDVTAVECNRAVRDVGGADDGINEFALTVALDTGDADDLTLDESEG